MISIKLPIIELALNNKSYQQFYGFPTTTGKTNEEYWKTCVHPNQFLDRVVVLSQTEFVGTVKVISNRSCWITNCKLLPVIRRGFYRAVHWPAINQYNMECTRSKTGMYYYITLAPTRHIEGRQESKKTPQGEPQSIELCIKLTDFCNL